MYASCSEIFGRSARGESAEQRDEGGQTRRQPVRAKGEVVAELVREQQQHDDDRELPAEDDDVDPQREQERPADRKELRAKKQQKFEFQHEGEQRCGQGADAALGALASRLGRFFGLA